MRWRRLERSRNVQDRRGTTPRRGSRAAVGGGGLGAVALILVLAYCGGGDTQQLGPLLEDISTGQAVPQQQPPQIPVDQEAFDDDIRAFSEAVLGSTETLWTGVFAEAGLTYQPATFVIFEGFTDSACGGANSQVGPHYCPLDDTIYIDFGFFQELQRRFGAAGGDFAEAYVIAHEVAHHVQNELGISSEVRQLQQQNPNDANDLSVALELQADCLAGVWAFSIFQRENILESGDIGEAMDAAAAVGDDRIQATVTGRVTPESWTHGSSEQRQFWFQEGYRTGDPNVCDTFN